MYPKTLDKVSQMFAFPNVEFKYTRNMRLQLK